ncbi:uncharacterized protein CcaverHIS019_0106230 [Cutaneotrichosporon cavernicola]|uniref:Bacteriophage T5 Orf172 DNA-binding domain-containing protein n=1 Tax=Cutaneotrichosporon cavernicola TaxID=279322 RepID=A0AA48L089_9TREE|nr:uncharacterized protein CcaverHIS019_0106230 [Cutaneotrichosporon cavernicola]BEI87905.1 hypothetical protein CcaverHIS019_0106230 [Cutaneotrichosporon cavernicola]
MSSTSPLPPDYTFSTDNLPPPPYTAAPPIPPRPARHVSDLGPAHPPIRRGSSEDRGGSSSWRRLVPTLRSAMNRLDIVSGSLAPPLPPRARTTSAPLSKAARTLSHDTVPSSTSPPSLVSSSATTSAPARKKLTKFIATSPSGVSFMSPLYAAASTPKKPAQQGASPISFRTVPPRRGRDVIDLRFDSDDKTPESSGEEAPRRTSWTVAGASAVAASTSKATPPKVMAKKTKPKIAPKRPAPAPPSAPSTPTTGSSKQTRSAPATTPLGDDGDAPRVGAVGRYCRDHAGMVCAADGFYWRDAKGKSGVYVAFNDYIPTDLGQQTQALLRVTMDSPLTAKEAPGFIYAYELRTLSGGQTAYFKVGRSDNVPRRMGQWSAQCGYVPTLRDVFPLKARAVSGAGVTRAPSILGTFLPGATKAGTDASRMIPAVKRWERLVHLELADRAAAARPKEYDALCKPCSDCGTVHQEIFPLEGDPQVYEHVVVDAIERWERFVRVITET